MAGTTSRFSRGFCGFFLDRISLRIGLPAGESGRSEAFQVILGELREGLPVDHIRRDGYIKRAYVGGERGTPGRLFLEHSEYAKGVDNWNRLRVEFNPSAELQWKPDDLVTLIERLGGSFWGGDVIRFDAAVDIECDARLLALDDRRRKWTTHYGASGRESQYVGIRGGPLMVRLYDKSKQMLEVHGVQSDGKVTRIEAEVRPSSRMECEDVETGEILRVPSDRMLAGIADWEYPFKGCKVRVVDPSKHDGEDRIWTLYARDAGVRAVMSNREYYNGRKRSRIESLWPILDLEEHWAAWKDNVNRAFADFLPDF